MLVKISKLDGDEFLTSFPAGLHVLGRNSDLQCNDKRVSRNHASIEVTAESVKLTSTHINPCFLRAASSKTLTILSKDSTAELNDGDAFAFLPEDFWFKVKIFAEEVSPEGDTKSVTLKRLSIDYEDAPPDKKVKVELNGDNENNPSDLNTMKRENKIDLETGETSTKSETANNSENVESKDDQNPEDNNQITDVPAEVDDGTCQEDAASNNEPNPGAGTTASPQNPGNDPGPSNTKLKREKCWYGVQCYRKNPVHRQDYTHPGDSDYESDPNDDRPACPYGAQCYRKNKDHRRVYKHPPRQPPGKKKRNRKKVDRLNVADSEEMRLLDDSEDPFIDDDDSDEYTGGSSDEDSDWEDSQEIDEDKDNVKRLVKEANTFVKK